jgi:hypothetical protein
MNTLITTQSSLSVWKKRTVWMVLMPTAAVLCLLALPALQLAQAQMGDGLAHLEGTWLVTATLPDGSTAGEVYQAYTPGGVATGSDPSWVSASSTRATPWYGTWARKGCRDFAFKMVGSVNEPPWGFVRYTLWETVTVAEDGETYDGESRVEIRHPDGTLAGEFSGAKTHGVRIKTE